MHTSASSGGPPAVLYVGVYQKRPLIGDLHLGDVTVSSGSFYS
jgi:hypothetical protein